MSVPRRLLDEGTDFERELLSSARLDVGSTRSFKKTLAAMSAVASLGTAAAGAGASVGGGLGTSAASVGASGALALVKWVGLGMVVGLGATGSTAWRERRESAPPITIVVPASPPPTATPSRARAAPPETSPLDIPAMATAPAIAPRPVPKAAPLRQLAASAPPPQPLLAEPAAPKASIPPSASIEAEVGALADVRAALAAGDARAALAKLDAYGRAFPNAALAEEATVLHVDALSLQGDRASAAAIARRFLAANPASPHAPHLAAVVARVQNP
jgi:hypothetical protein